MSSDATLLEITEDFSIGSNGTPEEEVAIPASEQMDWSTESTKKQKDLDHSAPTAQGLNLEVLDSEDEALGGTNNFDFFEDLGVNAQVISTAIADVCDLSN